MFVRATGHAKGSTKIFTPLKTALFRGVCGRDLSCNSIADAQKYISMVASTWCSVHMLWLGLRPLGDLMSLTFTAFDSSYSLYTLAHELLLI